MSRIIVPSARVVAPARNLVLPIGMKRRASIHLDPTDDRIVGSNPLAGSQAFTILMRCRQQANAPSLAMAMQLGTLSGGHGLFIGSYAPASAHYPYVQLAGIATAQDSAHNLADHRWHRYGCRFAGGTAKLQLLFDGLQTAETVGNVTPDITGSIVYLGYNGSTYPFGGWLSDVRIYARYLSDAEVAADKRGEWVDPTGLVRWWTCENPGYGSTCHEEIGNTEDPITGATWSPVVPFRRWRVVENVLACPNLLVSATGVITVAHHTDLDPGAGSFGMMGWIRGPLAVNTGLVGKIASAGYPNVPGWFCYGGNNGILVVLIKDGTLTTTLNSRILTGGHHHLAIVRDTTTGLLLVYIDAGAPTTAATTVGSLTSAADLAFHRIPGLTTCNVPGRSNDWIWRKGSGFTWDEIAAHFYDGIIPANPGGGVVQIGWAMREGSGLTAHSDPPGYDGTLSAASWTTSTRCKARSAA